MVIKTSHLTNFKSTVHFPCKTSKSNQQRSYSPLSPRATTIRMSTTTHPYWASLHADVEAHLKHSITIKEPLVVFEPMHHLIFNAPKTTVPALCLAACELVGGQRHQAIPAASALLLMDSATHIHEHLPLTCRPKPVTNHAHGNIFLTTRPGPKPATTHVYGTNVELLTGDGIVPFGFELLARSNGEENSERILRVMIEISRAVGSGGVIDAQYRKMLVSGSNGEEMCHVEEIKRVVEKYEGGLHSCAAVCGGVLGGGSEEEIERLRKFGFYVGIIQGMLLRGFKEDNEEVEDARNLALHELKFFKENNKEVDSISTFLNI